MTSSPAPADARARTGRVQQRAPPRPRVVQDKDYSKRVQEYYDKYKQKKKPLVSAKKS